MHKLLKNIGGVSPVIATLMLVIVAVGAATSFAFFVQQQTQDYQESEAAKQEREIELISINAMKEPTYGGVLSELNATQFLISNVNPKTSDIVQLRINDYVVKKMVILRNNLSKEFWQINTTTGSMGFKRYYEDYWNFIYHSDRTIVELNPDGIIASDATPSDLEEGGLYAFDNQAPPEPFTFKDNDYDWLFNNSIDTIIEIDADKDGIDANTTENYQAGIFAFDSQTNREPFLFIDQNNNWIYDDGETILSTDAEIDTIQANPEHGNVGGFYAFDTADEPYTYNNWRYTNSAEKKDFELKQREQLWIIIEDVDTYLYKDSSEQIYINDALTFKVQTMLTNTFEKTFIPPTSIIQVNTEVYWDDSSSDFKEFKILDGTLSEHPSDGYITKWDWQIIKGTKATLLGGKKVRGPTWMTGVGIDISLTTKDNYGMTGNSEITYP